MVQMLMGCYLIYVGFGEYKNPLVAIIGIWLLISKGVLYE